MPSMPIYIYVYIYICIELYMFHYLLRLILFYHILLCLMNNLLCDLLTLYGFNWFSY